MANEPSAPLAAAKGLRARKANPLPKYPARTGIPHAPARASQYVPDACICCCLGRTDRFAVHSPLFADTAPQAGNGCERYGS